jgi:hypothetical protein
MPGVFALRICILFHDGTFASVPSFAVRFLRPEPDLHVHAKRYFAAAVFSGSGFLRVLR